ncbi:MAG: PH domain-containing protein [Acutalibacteraceae bacterium]
MKLSKKSKTIWRLRCTIAAVLFAMISGGICAFNVYVGLISACVWLVPYFFGIILYIPLLYGSYEFTISEDFLNIKKGIVFNKHIIVNLDKILYVETVQTPMQRRMDIYSMLVHTAGSVVVLSQIDKSSANEVRSAVKKSKEDTT